MGGVDIESASTGGTGMEGERDVGDEGAGTDEGGMNAEGMGVEGASVGVGIDGKCNETAVARVLLPEGCLKDAHPPCAFVGQLRPT